MQREISGLILKSLRENGKTQKWLAEETGVTPQALNMFLCGKRTLSMKTIRRTVEALGYELKVVKKHE